MSESERNPFHEPERPGAGAALPGGDEVRDLASAQAPPGPLSNRPAHGARRATMGEVLSTEFMGSEGASDFLGLDTEIDAASEGFPLEDGELELRTDPFGGSTEEPSADEAEEAELAPAVVPAAVAYGDAGPDGLDEPDLDGPSFASDDEEDEHDLLLEPERSKRGLGFYLTATVVGAGLCVGAALYLPDLLGEEPTPPVVPPRVATASRTTPARTTEPAGAPAAASTTASTRAADPTGAPVAAPVAAIDPPPEIDPAAPLPPLPFDPRFLVASSAGALLPALEGAAAAQPLDPFTAGPRPFGTDPAAVEPAGPGADGAAAGSTSVALPGEGIEPRAVYLSDFVLQQSGAEALIAENPGDLDLVWRGRDIPLDAIHAPATILTPLVGQVRASLTSGDSFDGRLHAVGEGRVWLDLDLGRIALDGARVTGIERLTDGPVETLDEQVIRTGQHVRAQVPGGVIYGRIRSVDGRRVTIVTDEGGRITLEDPVLEPVSEKRSVALKM